MANWWERFGIDSSEITAPVEAALVGVEVYEQWVDAASALILEFIRRHAVQFIEGESQQWRQARWFVLVGALFRQVGSAYEEAFARLADPDE